MDANQARRRTDLDPVSHDTGSILPTPKAFSYEPLDFDPDADSIRLGLIEQSTNHDDQISCSLIHAKFADKRKYRALSYMWGDEAVKTDILLNGAHFQVGQNLWDALHYFRSSGIQSLYWMDAICINQRDIEGRNRQLAMMRWIYFRAETVVVWLGKKYSKYQMPNKLPDTRHPKDAKEIEFQESKETVKESEERLMVMELCSDGYWDRLWIIQEIGRARQKEVCFGTMSRDWNAFIEMATLHNSSCEGPLRLNRLLQEKYSGSHTLRKLLQDHQEALCKEPRDKIYGLVGLAADAIGFPMDYNKSLIEIWKDTMIFMNAQSLLPDSDIIPFGRLVKSLLIGDRLGPLEQTLRPYEPQANSALIIEDSNSPRVFTLRGFVVGYILAIGPSTDQIISSTRKADDWAGKIQQYCRRELGEAHCENDNLMRSILDFNKSQLASLCFSHVSNVRCSKRLDYDSILELYKPKIQEAKSRDDTSMEIKANTAFKDIRVSTMCASHLFLVENAFRGQTPWKMGVASSLAKPGDLVCWVHGVNRALILRVNSDEYKASLQIFGTALFTDDFSSNSRSSHSSRLSWFRESEGLEIQIDAATIYVLLA
ncbi:hypothetical protein N431DRAFT_414004 [Stipitochalara longipes BDJ]|nr:hypothetical protein N431DRAFT_414004 [Stipitochalara longipes BDJ]